MTLPFISSLFKPLDERLKSVHVSLREGEKIKLVSWRTLEKEKKNRFQKYFVFFILSNDFFKEDKMEFCFGFFSPMCKLWFWSWVGILIQG